MFVIVWGYEGGYSIKSPVATAVDQSFEFCRRLTRHQAGNFYFSFLTLPRVQRDAMCAIYAWMRLLDDLADDASSPELARTALHGWREQTHTALQRSVESAVHDSSFTDSRGLLWPAFNDTVNRYKVPHGHFDEIIEGALMDQERTRYPTFEDLYRYCYRVASVVGLVCLRVFGYADPRAEQTGEWLGIAFQITNILRDVREDAQRGRIYLPLEDLKRHGVSEDDVMKERWSQPLHELLRSFADRAEEYYVRSRPLTGLVSAEARPTLRIMTEIYHGILLQIRRMDYRVFERRASLPTWKKLAIVVKNHLIRNISCG